MGKVLGQQEVIDRIKEIYTQDIILVSAYINKRSNITLKCNECGYEWTITAQSALYATSPNGKKHCPNCQQDGIRIKNGSLVSCAYCGKEVYRANSRIERNKTRYFYCSYECGNRHKNQLRETSGEWLDSKNYRKKAFDIYEHKCKTCGWNEDERILEVHHLDENRENNNIDNLCILCPICHRKITLGYYKLDSNFQLNKV